MTLRRIAVYCASRPGTDPALVDTAFGVGRWLGDSGIGVVYGGGGAGLMGALADGALAAGGEVIGVIPRSMIEREWGRHDLTELHVVETMHERKAMMADLADAFLTLPGGLGTLEELYEMWTWRTLGYHAKPVGLLDAQGFWQPMLVMLERMVDAGYVSRATLDDLVVAPDIAGAVEQLRARLG